MNGLVRAELGKLRSIRSTWVLAALAVVWCVLWTTLAVTVFDPLTGAAGGTADQRLVAVYGMAQESHLFVLIMGVLGMTGEYRHQTITWSFLVSPVRERVLLAKAAAHVLVGLAVGVVAVTAAAGSAALLLSVAGREVFAPAVVPVLLGSVSSTAAYAVLGLAIGALARNQVAAVAVALGWFYYAENLLLWLLPGVARWLPSGAAGSLAGVGAPGADLLPLWGGAALLVAYVVALGAAARLVTLRRDVT